MAKMILVSNPGGASRKYALFQDGKRLLKLHFENEKGRVIYTAFKDGGSSQFNTNISHVTFAATLLPELLKKHVGIKDSSDISCIAMRVVAPSTYFQHTRVLDKPTLHKLTMLSDRAPIHVHATVSECHMLQRIYPKQKVIGISDSAFLAEKPEYAQYYGIPLKDSRTLDIKRYGYHGLSIESVVQALGVQGMVPQRLIVCHLGSGASVVALENGKCVDSSMGYSPNEGLIMATRSGSVDFMVTEQMKRQLDMTTSRLEEYLNNRSGLLGISGFSDDIRELLVKEKTDKNVELALRMYTYNVQKAIGQMSAVLGGVDALVFAGTVGERSVEIRKRIMHGLMYLGLQLGSYANHEKANDGQVSLISPASNPAKVYVVASDEETQMAKKAKM